MERDTAKPGVLDGSGLLLTVKSDIANGCTSQKHTAKSGVANKADIVKPDSKHHLGKFTPECFGTENRAGVRKMVTHCRIIAEAFGSHT